MITLQASLYAVAITSCLFFLFGERWFRERPEPPYRYLLVYLALESAGFMLEWLMVNPTSPGKSLWLGLLLASSLCVAPCLWLFAREIDEGAPPSPRSLSWPHLAVIGFGATLTLPVIQRAYWGPYFGNPEDLASPGHRLLIQGTMLACAVLFLVQVPYYLKACIRILASPHIEARALTALRLLIATLATTWVVSLLRVLHCMFLGKDTGWGVVFALLEVSASVVVVFLLARRRPVRGGQQFLEVGTSKYAKSSLDFATRARILRKLEAFPREGVHLDSGLTLRGLCGRMRENAHYVSQVINQDLGTNFYDLINRHRIASARCMLASSPEKTVLEIALAVGFNSKSTFNRAFREHSGSTPTQFRRQRRGQAGSGAVRSPGL